MKPALVEGQPVRLYNKDLRRWEPATVSGYADTPRSYYVERVAGGVPLRRNRVHLRTTRESFPGRRVDVSMDADEEEDVSSTARVVDCNVSVETNMDADNVGE